MVEVLIAAVSVVGSPQVITITLMATVMFISVVVAVTWLVAKYPEGLLAQKPSDLVMKQTEVMEKFIRSIKIMNAAKNLADEPIDIDHLDATGGGTVVMAPPPDQREET